MKQVSSALSRRGFLGAGIASATALGLSSAWSQSTPDLGAPDIPAAGSGMRKHALGKAELYALNDGGLRRPLGEEFVRNAPLEMVKALLASQKLPTDYVDIPFTAFLVVINGQKVLFDSGFADNGPPTTGRLDANMAAAGFKPEDIDHVVISHYHGDHINGLLRKDGSLRFANAKVHVPSPEHAFWTSAEKMSAAPPAAQGGFKNAQRVMAGIPADRLVMFDAGSEVVPGVRSGAAFGHTPGMCIFDVSSEGQHFVYVADVTNVPSLFARSPDWAVAFDMDAEMARQTRRRVFDMLVKEKTLAGGYHFPFPAFGKMEKAGEGYTFVPAS